MKELQELIDGLWSLRPQTLREHALFVAGGVVWMTALTISCLVIDLGL